MTTIRIYPLQGIDISGVGPVNLGQARSETEKLLGRPGDHSDNSRSFYPEYECRIDFDQSNTVEFIEFIYGPFPEQIQLSLYGIDPFQTRAYPDVSMMLTANAHSIAAPVDW
jgi:hypothetical protein